MKIGDISSIPVNKISDVAANVSIAYQPDIWENDMIYKDQDDCSKRMLCELNSRAAQGEVLTEHEIILAEAFGKDNNLDVGAETLEFDIAAVIGRKVGLERCELSYRRCEISVKEMLKMIDVEVEEIEKIQKELDVGAINLEDVDNRLLEEDEELAALSTEDLTKTTTTSKTEDLTKTTSTSKPSKSVYFFWE